MAIRHKVLRVTPEWTPDTYDWAVRPISFKEDYLSAKLIDDTLDAGDTVVSMTELNGGDLLILMRYDTHD